MALSCRGVGCIFYEMVSGRPMFPGSTAENELILIFKVAFLVLRLLFRYFVCRKTDLADTVTRYLNIANFGCYGGDKEFNDHRFIYQSI